MTNALIEERLHDCDVCGGAGYYPIYNQHGSNVYDIRCPECSGDGCHMSDNHPHRRNGDDPQSRRQEDHLAYRNAVDGLNRATDSDMTAALIKARSL